MEYILTNLTGPQPLYEKTEGSQHPASGYIELDLLHECVRAGCAYNVPFGTMNRVSVYIEVPPEITSRRLLDLFANQHFRDLCEGIAAGFDMVDAPCCPGGVEPSLTVRAVQRAHELKAFVSDFVEKPTEEPDLTPVAYVEREAKKQLRTVCQEIYTWRRLMVLPQGVLTRIVETQPAKPGCSILELLDERDVENIIRKMLVEMVAAGELL